MKRLCKAAFVLILFGICTISTWAAVDNASTGSNSLPGRNLTKSEIFSLLEKQAPRGMFPESTKVGFLGTVVNKYTSFNLVFTTLIWGEAQHETARLVIFSSDWKYLGNYGGLYVPPTSIHDGVVYWSYSAEAGNKIDLNGQHPPAMVVLNGEMYNFDSQTE